MSSFKLFKFDHNLLSYGHFKSDFWWLLATLGRVNFCWEADIENLFSCMGVELNFTSDGTKKNPTFWVWLSLSHNFPTIINRELSKMSLMQRKCRENCKIYLCKKSQNHFFHQIENLFFLQILFENIYLENRRLAGCLWVYRLSSNLWIHFF